MSGFGEVTNLYFPSAYLNEVIVTFQDTISKQHLLEHSARNFRIKSKTLNKSITLRSYEPEPNDRIWAEQRQPPPKAKGHWPKHVSEVIEQMKAQPDFWYNFPIFLPDHVSYGQNQQ